MGARPARRPRSLKQTLLVAAGFGISALFLYIAASKISLSEVGRSLSSANYWWLIPTTAVTLLTIWVRGVRWHALFERPEEVDARDTTAAVGVGLMMNNVLPSRAGEVARVFALRRTSGMSAFEIGTTILVERILDLVVLALAGLAIYPFIPHDQAWVHPLALICGGIVAGSVVLIGLLAVFRGRMSSMLARLLDRLPFVSPERAATIARAVVAGGRLLLNPRRMLAATALTVVVWFTVALSTWLLYPAFGLATDDLSPLLVLVANSFALTIPSGSGAVGVYEASVQASLVAFGVSSSTALSFALTLHAVNFFPVIACGLIASWYVGRRLPHGRFRQASAADAAT